jgi:amidophosphoribosyltransferase
LEYSRYSKAFEFAEGIIKDRYDDADHMIDFSEEVSKNKLLTTGRSLKFIMQNLTGGKKIATVQGTIQTGSTARETIYYLRKAGANRVDMIVSYVPTVDGRQVGLYTQNRDLIANKYVGEVSTINDLNQNIAKEIGSNSVYYNSPAILAKGIGVPEDNLWFPEWVRFLDYK